MDQRHFGSRSSAKATSSHGRAFITEFRSPRSRQPPSHLSCGAYANNTRVIIGRPPPIDAMSSYTTRAREDLTGMNRDLPIALKKEAAPTNVEDIDGHKMMKQLDRIYPTPVGFMKRAVAPHPSALFPSQICAQRLLRKGTLQGRAFHQRHWFINSRARKVVMRGFPRSKKSRRMKALLHRPRLP